MLQIARSEARDRYLHAVSGDLAPTREVVFLELAIDYNATLWLEDGDADTIMLVMDLPLADLPKLSPYDLLPRFKAQYDMNNQEFSISGVVRPSRSMSLRPASPC